MDKQNFHKLSRKEIANLMEKDGKKVCVFPLNGTRRWFMLEHPPADGDFNTAYPNTMALRLVELCRLLFDYGIQTLLLPVLSPHLFRARGEAYTTMTIKALSLLTSHPKFIDFYQEEEVRVRFYGDYKTYLSTTPFANLVDDFAEIAAQTQTNNRRCIFWGVCADDAVETTANLAVQYYLKHGRVPDKQALITQYYGEPLPPVNIFISSSKPRVFDIPLLSNGREDLYFTVAPSPYLTEPQLRDILYDHLFARRKEHSRYDMMQPQEWKTLRKFYQLNMGKTLGVGARQASWGIWYPLPQVILPEEA